MTPRSGRASAALSLLGLVFLAACPDNRDPLGVPKPEAADRAAPSLEIASLPASSLSIRDKVTLEGSAADNVAVERLTYQVNGGAEQPVAITRGASVGFGVEVPVALGQNTIVVRAHDAAGNTTQLVRTVDRREARMWRLQLIDLRSGDPIDDAEITIDAAPLALSSQAATIRGGAAAGTSATPHGAAPTGVSTVALLRGVSYRFVHLGNGVYLVFGPADFPLDLTFSAEGFLSLSYKGIALGADDLNEYEVLRLIDQGLVGQGGASGVVTDTRTGEPVPAAQACLVPAVFAPPTPPERCTTTQTGSDGRYTFVGRQAGYYTLYIDKAGYSMAKRPVVVIGENTIRDQHLSLDPRPTATLVVEVEAAGAEHAPPSFGVVLNTMQTQRVPHGGTATFAELAPRGHSLELTDLGPRCTVSPARLDIELAAGASMGVTFRPTCTPPLTGDARLVFASTRYTTSSDLPTALYLMNVDGTGVTPILSNATRVLGDSPAPATDGQRLAFRRHNSNVTQNVYVMNLDGTNLVNVSNTTGRNSAPAWSPDG